MFKKCSMCNKEFDTVEDFLSDSTFLGYQEDIDGELRFMIFNHTCGTSLMFFTDDIEESYKQNINIDIET